MTDGYQVSGYKFQIGGESSRDKVVNLCGFPEFAGVQGERVETQRELLAYRGG